MPDQKPANLDPRRSFQGLILTLQRYWQGGLSVGSLK